MSGAIGPDTWVECIDASAPAWALGRPFRVADVVDDADPCFMCRDAAPGVTLDDPRCGGQVYCTSCQVRPIYRRDPDFIRQLSQPAPDAVRELETCTALGP